MKKLRKPKRTNPALMKSVAQRLKEIRVEKGFSQEYVQENTDLNLSRQESGKVNVSLVTLEILCTYYGLTLAEFFDSIENQKIPDNTLSQI